MGLVEILTLLVMVMIVSDMCRDFDRFMNRFRRKRKAKGSADIEANLKYITDRIEAIGYMDILDLYSLANDVTDAACINKNWSGEHKQYDKILEDITDMLIEREKRYSTELLDLLRERKNINDYNPGQLKLILFELNKEIRILNNIQPSVNFAESKVNMDDRCLRLKNEINKVLEIQV